ncbi:MAG TPA: NAD(P)/FAD-dependent oxidoreductase [Chloroflexi bacterium]|nr:NAD(P)/FAD-dependent oxidoreductase [Chloroflexota bacterium]
MAAGRAAEMGAHVLLLEKTKRPGNKLRITGNGRCNLTNTRDVAGFIEHLTPADPFLRNAFARFFVQDLIAFFEARGIPTITEPDGRVFPASANAQHIVDALRDYCLEGGVRFRYNSPVDEIIVEDGHVRGVRSGETTIEARQVILATGGTSYPHTGSTGDGYRLAQRLGHRIAPIRPGLVPLVVDDPAIRSLQGLTLRDVRVALYRGERRLVEATGDLLFTHFGVSGPVILSLSMHLEKDGEGPTRLILDTRPHMDEATLDDDLRQRLAAMGRATVRTWLRSLVPNSFAEVIIAQSGVPADRRTSTLSAKQRHTIRRLLKGFSMTVSGTRPMAEAMVTLGGVDCSEIAPRTMASRLVDELYFAGEIMDVAGDTDGYNLQIAFTTGRMAGEAVARAILTETSKG